MPEKHEWKKKEQALYLPKGVPEIVEVPKMKFVTLRGAGSPANSQFSEIIGTLYAIAYGVKMHTKKMSLPPQGYSDYTVYPLEGVWDINDEAKQRFTGTVEKEDFVYQLMIRQPDFVDEALYSEVLAAVRQKKPAPLLEQLEFRTIAEGKCIQMLHIGRYEEEATSFAGMEAYARSKGLARISKVHREIYLSDARRVAPEKLRTVLRFQVK